MLGVYFQWNEVTHMLTATVLFIFKYCFVPLDRAKMGTLLRTLFAQYKFIFSYFLKRWFAGILRGIFFKKILS